jgi:type III secretory pathway component EscV
LVELAISVTPNNVGDNFSIGKIHVAEVFIYIPVIIETAIELVQFAYFKEVTSKADEEEEPMVEEQQEKAKEKIQVTEERYKHFMRLLYKCTMEKYQAQSLAIDEIRKFLAKTTEKSQPFTEAELDVLLDKMQDDNKVMRSGDTVYLI